MNTIKNILCCQNIFLDPHSNAKRVDATVQKNTLPTIFFINKYE